ncbi:replication factor C subunit 1 [Galendromus occidentalis]|uniref:Replication factor C subunit 1 n=1 Tax=Galendromus occidentalis TaxID=34638 RepID=A0AAJ6VZK2_9ACAR|nr:replication factor C subunit 1 [Galendromus occidentalis]
MGDEAPKKRKIESDEEVESATKRRKETSAPEPSPRGRASTGNGASYLAYLNREPPRHLGEKDHPEGSPECMKKFTIVMTGVMDYVEKDEIKRIVEQCGGKITSSISGKTTHLIAGRDAGPAKVARAQAVGAKVLEELEWFDYVESITDTSKAFKAKERVDPVEEVMMEIEEAEAKAKAKKSSPRKPKSDPAREGAHSKTRSSPEKRKETQSAAACGSESQPSTSAAKAPPALMWVDKYMPSATKQIIGQQGDQSNVAKLRRWLTQWSTKQKAPFNKFKNPTGAGLRAALLSGPPGVGKTTSAHLVCKELGFEIIEMNASDTRSKRSLKEEVATLLSNRTLNSTNAKRKHVLIMDEVDGMSGNQDRGGMQELIQLIKSSMVPIICICNDRTHPKMRSLVNYCFDLRFYKPQVKQIQAALMSLCFKEGVKVPPKTIEEIIVASNQDIRQCVHSLNLFCAINDSSSKQQVTKDVKIGPFDVVKKFLVSSEGGSLNLNERQSLFFNDYNAVPLFVQENYIKVQPKNCVRKRDLLQRLSDSSEAICIGDTVDRQIRSSNAWALLSVQAMYAAVIPSVRMQGTMREMVNFPGWFGKYSTTGKHARQAQALNAHMKCLISGDTFETTTQYMPLMTKKIMMPLLKEGESGVDKVVNFMDAYSLQRSDVDAMLELTSWNTQGKDPFADVPSKVKAKLTRSLNKHQMLRYATDDMIKSKGKKMKKEKSNGGDDEDVDDLSEDEVEVDFD